MLTIVLPDPQLEQLAERFCAARLGRFMSFEQFCAMRDDARERYLEGALALTRAEREPGCSL